MRENQNPGVAPGVWDLAGGKSDPLLAGFSTDISYEPGETVAFKVKTEARAYRLDVYRLGWYGGKGARLLAAVRPSVPLPQSQPPCNIEPIDCDAWRVSASWSIPAGATSGVYLAKLVRTDGTASPGSHIVFVVRDPAGRSDLLFQTSDTTWQAYNSYGGFFRTSLYNGAVRVSYNRPLTARETNEANSFFGVEYNMVRFLERNGFDVSYTTGVDTARRGAELLRHKAFLSVGHDEYWSGEQRANVEAARAAGVHLAFFSGNEIFWKTRWEAGFRTMVCYKQTSFNAEPDPSSIFTGTWRDPRFRTADDPPRPENALSGTIFAVNATQERQILVPAADGKMRLWRNTPAAAQPECGVYGLAPFTLGYEWDHDEDNGSRPPGLLRLSSTYTAHAPVLYGYGTDAAGSFFNELSGDSLHHLTLYRHPSGALVFGAGTIKWAWGLDNSHLAGRGNAAMQQATVNLFADMGVQPATLASGLVAASASLDGSPPSSAIIWPAAGSSVRLGSRVAITGTAADAQGQVGGVEVSVDGGATWHRAEGRESFRYVWMASAAGAVTLMSRAVDDSGNLEQPGAGVGVNVDCGSGGCSLWGPADVPAVRWVPDLNPIEVGLRFQSDADGQVAGIRFFKGRRNRGPHRVHLFSAAGALLAVARSTGESATGWQTVRFDPPVAIQANTPYIAAYSSRTGYASDLGAWSARGRYAQPLRAGKEAGVFSYGASGSFPDQPAGGGANYWVDVVFNAGRSLPRGLFAAASVPAVATHPDPEPAEVGIRFRSDTDGLVAGIRFYQGPGNTGTHVVNLWAPAPTAASKPTAGDGRLLASATAGVESRAAGSADDPGSPGPLGSTGSPGSTGSSIGWQRVDFAVPVEVTAGVEYVASVHSTTGYALNPGYFAKAEAVDPPLTALGAVMRHGKSAFPHEIVKGANFWVDPVFIPTAPLRFSLWSDETPAATPPHTDPAEVEVGVKFEAEVDGYVAGIRFYKHALNSGAHTGSLWTADGRELASGAFTQESACGWQTMTFDQPVKIAAGATYVASYHSTTGYALEEDFFRLAPAGWRGVWNPPLRALPSGEAGAGPNGVQHHGPHAFPETGSPADANHWVDVVFQTAPHDP
ncbi:MAG TPA: DUF4082 domain-containing protein [Thermoanaerobaculia bacterium]|nr:DUF4082 domain-containing protein [Thermoanaerobaculia bacterium]